MKDRPINDVFYVPEYGELMVVAEGAVNECYGCIFNGAKHCENDVDKIHTGSCALSERSDKCGVIFIKELFFFDIDTIIMQNHRYSNIEHKTRVSATILVRDKR